MGPMPTAIKLSTSNRFNVGNQVNYLARRRLYCPLRHHRSYRRHPRHHSGHFGHRHLLQIRNLHGHRNRRQVLPNSTIHVVNASLLCRKCYYF